MLKFPTHSGFHDLFLNFNMMCFIGYINYAVIEFPIYFTSHMGIAGHNFWAISSIYTGPWSIQILNYAFCFFKSIDFNFCKLSSSGDVVSRKRW